MCGFPAQEGNEAAHDVDLGLELVALLGVLRHFEHGRVRLEDQGQSIFSGGLVGGVEAPA